LSSILNALKKLDREPAEKVEIRPLAQTLDTAKIIRKHRDKRWSLRIMYLVGLVLIIGAGGMLFSHLLLNKPASEKNVPASGKAGDKTVSQNMLDHDAGKPGGLEKKVPLAVDQTGPPHRAVTSVVKEQALAAKSDDSANSVTRIEIAPAADVHKNIVPTAKVGDERQRQERTELPRLDYSVLRLQAVTWAVDPQDRFVLVDNAILRKGETVKGFVVDSIHEDHVVVRKGSERWRVEFRLR
jgi:hypothetical protein